MVIHKLSVIVYTHHSSKWWPSLPVILISGVNEIPPDATFADLFMSKVEGSAMMCQNINDVLIKYRS